MSSIFFSGDRVRPPWKIAVYLLLFLLLAIAGNLAISVLPRHPLQWGSLLATTAAALLAGWILISKLDDRPLGALGFPLHSGAGRESLFGFAIGGGLIVSVALLLFATGSLQFVPDSGSAGGYGFFLGWTLVYFTLAATFEEALFRGYPFQALVEWVGPWPATLFASALFALLHGSNPNVTLLAIANIFLAGVLLSLAYLRTRSLWFATGVHVGWNWSMASLFDLPVSGLGFETPLYSGVAAGDDWWTGGAFGPEAGIVGTLVLLGGTGWLLRTRRVGPAPEMQRLAPLVDARLGPGGPF